MNGESRAAKQLSSNKHIDQACRISIATQALDEQKIVVRENIPVSKTEELTVGLNVANTTKG